MAATAADIAAAGRDGAVATWTDATIAGRYPSARDGSVSPAPGYFDAIADALTVINARGNLIGVERRRFVPVIADLVWPDLSAGLVQDQLIDPEHAVNAGFLGARVEVDLDAETTTHELFG